MSLATGIMVFALAVLGLAIGALSIRTSRIVCPSCSGGGFIRGAACFRCRGRGWLP